MGENKIKLARRKPGEKGQELFGVEINPGQRAGEGNGTRFEGFLKMG